MKYLVTLFHTDETIGAVHASTKKEAEAKARAQFDEFGRVGVELVRGAESMRQFRAASGKKRGSMKRKAKKHAGNFARRGTGHIHPPGPRRCPKCGV